MTVENRGEGVVLNASSDSSRIALITLIFVPLILSPFLLRMYAVETGQSVNFEIFLIMLLLIEFTALIGFERTIVPMASKIRGTNPILEKMTMELRCKSCNGSFFADMNKIGNEIFCPHCENNHQIQTPMPSEES